jgi:hypothetical protein
MAAREAPLSITGGPLGEDSINLVYYPNKLTTAAVNQFDQGLDGMNQTLSEIIKSWDVTDDDGNPYPITPDSLQALGIGVVRLVGMAIVEDLRPN